MKPKGIVALFHINQGCDTTFLFWGGWGGGGGNRNSTSTIYLHRNVGMKYLCQHIGMINQTQNINEYIQDSIPVPMYFAPETITASMILVNRFYFLLLINDN